ncbi:MAG: gfo/Idh/MocA family oxidoreductase [Acidobacteria bacterium]|nr:gfo/Idh/MocA family oxidoreductase [Acidobacteriota bacterium]
MSDFVSRRTFLAGAGALATSALSAAPSNRVAIGMIGCGARAHQLMNGLLKTQGTEIVSVFDGYKGRLERAVERTGGRAKIADSYQAILADPSVDAVVVASPDHWHAKQVIEAMEAGKDVYCEKPLTWAIDEGLEIAKAVERTGKILQVGSQGISTKTQQKVREIVQSGQLGRVTMIRAYYNRNSASGAWIYPIPPDASPETVDWELFLGSAPERPFNLERFFRWRCYQDYSGGIATDLFVHLTTTIHYVMNAKAPADVFASGELYRWKESRNVPDTLNAILRYPEGFTVNLSSTFNNSSGGYGFDFLGTEGAISLGYVGYELRKDVARDNNGWIVESWPSALQDEYERKHPEESERVEAPEPEEFRERSIGETRLHLGNWISSIRTREQPVEDVWAGHRAAACAHMVNASVRERKVIEWDFERDNRKA